MGTDDLREKSIEETQQISPRNAVDALCGSFKHDGNTNPLGRENVKIPCKHILKENLHLFQVALAKAGPRYALWERLRLHLILMPFPLAGANCICSPSGRRSISSHQPSILPEPALGPSAKQLSNGRLRGVARTATVHASAWDRTGRNIPSRRLSRIQRVQDRASRHIGRPRVVSKDQNSVHGKFLVGITANPISFWLRAPN